MDWKVKHDGHKTSVPWQAVIHFARRTHVYRTAAEPVTASEPRAKWANRLGKKTAAYLWR